MFFSFYGFSYGFSMISLHDFLFLVFSMFCLPCSLTFLARVLFHFPLVSMDLLFLMVSNGFLAYSMVVACFLVKMVFPFCFNVNNVSSGLLYPDSLMGTLLKPKTNKSLLVQGTSGQFR